MVDESGWSYERIKDPELRQRMIEQAREREKAERGDKQRYEELRTKTDVPVKHPPRR